MIFGLKSTTVILIYVESYPVTKYHAESVKRVTNYLDPCENLCDEQHTSKHIYCLVASYLMKCSPCCS